jgi:polyisoprenoid-binding protein YceI
MPSVEAEILAASVNTGNVDRDAHLRGLDFFDVDRHPMITFRSTATRPRAESTWEGTGDLTVRDVTRPVVVQVDRGRAPRRSVISGSRSARQPTSTETTSA